MYFLPEIWNASDLGILGKGQKVFYLFININLFILIGG